MGYSSRSRIPACLRQPALGQREHIESLVKSDTSAIKLQNEEGPLAGPMVGKRQIHHADKA